jgi:hypothetical protein
VRSIVKQLRSQPRKGKLDPRWALHTKQHFEIESGYADYYDFCRSRAPRARDAVASALVEIGREQFPVTTAAAAGELEREIVARFKDFPTAEKAPHLTVFEIDDLDFRKKMLETILTEEVDARVARFFGCEYFVYGGMVSRSSPVDELGLNSFRWHCDRGPRAHLKLIYYLNDAAEHGGGTDFLDLEATRRLEPTGYVFAPVKTRVADLAPLAAQAGLPYAPFSLQPGAGEGILFQPAGVLHRGVLSTRGPRHAVTICLLPSPVAWREALARGAPAAARGEYKWHEDAAEIRAALAPPQ